VSEHAVAQHSKKQFFFFWLLTVVSLDNCKALFYRASFADQESDASRSSARQGRVFLFSGLLRVVSVDWCKTFFTEAKENKYPLGKSASDERYSFVGMRSLLGEATCTQFVIPQPRRHDRKRGGCCLCPVISKELQ
jgi:hypothetical protein